VAAVGVLAGASLAAGLDPIGAWWFWVGATAALTAAVVQPYFTDPFAALMYGLAGVGAFASATRTGVESLWALHLALSAGVSATALLSLTLSSGKPREMCKWLSTRLGRPLILGFGALAIENLRLAADQSLNVAGTLAMGAFAALLLSSLDWYRLWSMTPFVAASVASIETAIEPNLILISTGQRLPRGTRVRVTGKGIATGVVASNLAHKAGNRVQIVLDEPWVKVAAAAGAQCIVEVIAVEDDPPVAFAAEGSTERSLVLHPFGTLTYGDTVRWDREGRTYLYQVTDLRLERLVWDGSTVIEERASAIQLGGVGDGGSVEFDPILPDPYQPVRSARTYKVPLPSGHRRIGMIAGTAVEFGVSPEALGDHHLAILGMSGMGKSTVSRRITEIISDESFVVAMDGTGEYRSRFEFEVLDLSRTSDDPGRWVHEPVGEPALKARDFIKSLMDSGNDEYKVGIPRRRTLLLEEAHSYLPEWNFNASKEESAWVSKSCRYILQARKFGLSFILVSQRTAVISKSALSQCESYLIFRTLDATSLEYVESIAGKAMREAVSSLARFQAVCVGPAFSTTSPVIVDLDPHNAADPTDEPPEVLDGIVPDDSVELASSVS